MEYNLADLFESIVDRVPDRPALVTADESGEVTRRLTYRELDEHGNRVARHLRSLGIGAGDHVGCHLTNGLDYVGLLIGCFKIGAVPVNVNYRYVEQELRYLYDDADLVAVFHDPEFAGPVHAVAPEVATIRDVVETGDAYDREVAEHPSERDFGPRSADALWLLYTGGTTGMPKGVMWRHEDIFFAGMGGGNPVGEPVSSPEGLAARIDPDAEFTLTMFAAPPLMHGAAQLGTFIGWWGGSRVALIRRFTGHGALRLVAEEGVNTISIVGDAMAIPLIEAADEGDYDLSSLFVISTAGAIMSATVRRALAERVPNAHILDSFGSSETGYGGSEAEGSSPDRGLRFRMTARTAVVTDDHRLVEPGSGVVGRVAQRGHIPLGYYNRPEDTAASFPVIGGERWVVTGDHATVDADGVIHVLGRGSVCINTGGEKVFPEEVEAALKSHPDVVDAIVVGVPDERWGQRVAAVVQARPGAAVTLADVETHLADRIARYKVPRVVRVVERIERSPVGKPDYRWATQAVTATPQPPVTA